MLHAQFNFRQKIFSCDFITDSSDYPGYVFLFLNEPELITEFGQDITIKTDFENVLPKRNDYPELIALNQTIFDTISTMPEIADARQELKTLLTTSLDKLIRHEHSHMLQTVST